MPYHCAVLQCKSKLLAYKAVHKKTEKTAVSFFEFPLSPTRKRDWLVKIGRPYYRPVRSSRICSLHFHEKELVRKGNEVILNENAVPLTPHSTENKTPRRLTQNSSSNQLEFPPSQLRNITTRRISRSSSNILKEPPLLSNITTRRLTRSSSNLSKEHLTLSDITNRQLTSNAKKRPKKNKSSNNNTIRQPISSNLPEEITSLQTSTPLANDSTNRSLRNITLNQVNITILPLPSNITTRRLTRGSLKLAKQIAPLTNEAPGQLPNKENVPSSAITTRRSTRNSPKPQKEIAPLTNRTPGRPTKAMTPSTKRTAGRPTREMTPFTKRAPGRPPKEIAPLTKKTSAQPPPDKQNISNSATTLGNSNKRVSTDSLVPENEFKIPRPVGGANRNKRVTTKPLTTVSNNQLSIKNFLTTAMTTPEQTDNSNATVSSTEDCVFGWTTNGEHHIPYLMHNSEKHCALRMINMTVLADYQRKKTPTIGSCGSNIQCYDPTAVQCSLLNEINLKHCECRFGKALFTWKDQLVRLSDACKYHKFVETAQLNGAQAQASAEGHEFGFTFVRKFIPLTYLSCDGEILECLHAKARKLLADDGISEVDEWIDVIDLDEIQRLWPPNTTFRDRWPTGQENCHLRVVQTTKGLRLKYDKRFT